MPGGHMPTLRQWLTLVATSLSLALPTPARAQGRGRGQTVNLPEGPGKEFVQSLCASCHSLSNVTNDGYTRQEWQYVISTMVELPREHASAVLDYLAEHYPEKPKPPAVLIDGSATATFKEWTLPT